MGSFYEAGEETLRSWLKVNVCYSLGLGVEFSDANCAEECSSPHVAVPYST
jgi:hypothetical protein